MEKALCFILIISLLMMGPFHSYGLELIDKNENIELAKAWKLFLKTLVTQDMTTFRNLSAARIRCLSCLENTEAESKEMIKQQSTDPDWDEKLYEEKIYVPIHQFCKEDYPILFTKEFIKILQHTKPVYGVEEFNKQHIYEVIIATSKPDELSSEHEGSLHLFQFIKTKSGYRFWGTDTIP